MTRLDRWERSKLECLYSKFIDLKKLSEDELYFLWTIHDLSDDRFAVVSFDEKLDKRFVKLIFIEYDRRKNLIDEEQFGLMQQLQSEGSADILLF